MDNTISLQDQFAPKLICFGCGPANEKGLQIKSFVDLDNEGHLICSFSPQQHQQAFEGMVNGGIIGSLLDCHLNWTAAWHLMQKNELDVPPCCVTAKYEVTFEKPTPSNIVLKMDAWIVESTNRKAVVEGTIGPDGDVTARCCGTFVSVKPDHPAFHRW